MKYRTIRFFNCSALLFLINSFLCSEDPGVGIVSTGRFAVLGGDLELREKIDLFRSELSRKKLDISFHSEKNIAGPLSFVYSAERVYVCDGHSIIVTAIKIEALPGSQLTLSDLLFSGAFDAIEVDYFVDEDRIIEPGHTGLVVEAPNNGQIIVVGAKREKPRDSDALRSKPSATSQKPINR